MFKRTNYGQPSYAAVHVRRQASSGFQSLTVTCCWLIGLSWSLPTSLGKDQLVSLSDSSQSFSAAERGRATSELEKLAQKANPTFDDWETEVLNETASSQLKALGKLIQHPEMLNDEHLAGIIGDDFSCQTLRPAALRDILNDGILLVRRSAVTQTAEPSPGDDHRGVPGLVAAAKELKRSLGKGNDIRFAFKLFNIEKSESFFTTRLHYEASNRSNDHGTQQNATWLCRWAYPPEATDDKPKLLWIGIEQYEEVLIQAPGGQMFSDCTESVLAANESYEQLVLPGVEYWQNKNPGISNSAHHGFAIGDVNGDGLEDLYVCDGYSLPNQLYLQQLDGTLRDVSAELGMNLLDNTSSALLIDLDNDGDQDLVIALRYNILFFANDGTGQFTGKSRFFGINDPKSMAAADYDEDGDLDIFICGYSTSSSETGILPQPIPYHDANNGLNNVLLRNNGDMMFSDVTDQVGLNQNNTRFSFAAAWDDFDNDGDLDLYVANDFGRNNLYQNDNGHFTDIAPLAGVEDIATGMSASWGDYNRDGLVDVYISNMFSSAGNRIAYQTRFAPNTTGQTVAYMQRTARGNSLFANSGNGTFHDVSELAGVTMGRWAWGSKFVDLNNDGWQDLVVTNGLVTNDDTGDL